MKAETQNPALVIDDTPMMRQYQGIKTDYPDAILFFRMGDFYEMFNEDAKTASAILSIALTARNKNQSNPIPMCGVPHHAAKAYIAKLIQAGKKVAICEQMEDPKLTKGLVKRGVVRVVTPGTVLDDEMLDPKSNQFVVSIVPGTDGWGLAAIDLTTGLFKATEFFENNAETLLAGELDKLDSREIIVPESAAHSKVFSSDGYQAHSGLLQPREDWTFSYREAYRKLTEQFKTGTLEGFGAEQSKLAVSAAGGLLHYLQETQKSELAHINSISLYHPHDHMLLDQTTIRSLELIQSSEGTRKRSLLGLLDLSQTPLGARRIKEWILKPLIDREGVEERLEMVSAFKENPIRRDQARKELKTIHDLERLTGRISLEAGNGRDLIALKNSLGALPRLLEILRQYAVPAIEDRLRGWDDLQDVRETIEKRIVDDPPLNLKDGNLIKPGCDEELDRLQSIRRDGKKWIAKLEGTEKERTGISVLKVGYNKIYGYYIEITKKHQDRVPEEYIRKQSLVNAERYISPKLKEFEETLAGAEEKIAALELDLFHQVRKSVAAEGSRIQNMAQKVGQIDALYAFAECAHRYNYCRPSIHEETALVLENARHPLIEHMDPVQQFIPNDTRLDGSEDQILIITGPNMAGKSTYLRQVALIALMAQIGSFVPAEKAEIGLVDRIFSRVGAQDHLLKGQSTFMVEMNETANILNNATPKSLIILDEIGRGTSTFDGISIAWSIVEFLAEHYGETGPKTLFATHYHELTDLALSLPRVKNFYVQVKEWNDEIIFLRKIAPGGADKSYGIQVARLAGLPRSVLQRALEVLYNLEKNEFDEVGRPKISHSEEKDKDPNPQQLTLFNDPRQPALKKLNEIDPDSLSPRQALDWIYELHELLRQGRS